MSRKIYRTIGVMSGTSLDGIDVALIETDGQDFIKRIGFFTTPFNEDLCDKLRKLISSTFTANELSSIIYSLTNSYISSIDELLKQLDYNPNQIDVIGLHGQTIYHNPMRDKFTWQIANHHLVEAYFGVKTIFDFRNNDIAHGGHGAPLVPIYHHYLLRSILSQNTKSVAMINIGGISNITYSTLQNEDDLIAFDLGPACALLNDFVKSRAGLNYDENGEIAANGCADQSVVKNILAHPYFSLSYPKSLDRADFALATHFDHLSLADGAATITQIVARIIVNGLSLLPQQPSTMILSGGGAYNKELVRIIFALAATDNISVYLAEELSLDGQSLNCNGIEAEAFAFLAVRSLRALPFSFKNTTGITHTLIAN